MARIAIDLHGGDFGPSVTLPSSIQFFKQNPQHSGVFAGRAQSCPLDRFTLPKNVQWVEADELGDKSQKPSRLLRTKGNSSVEVAFRMLEDQAVDTLVSAEHTGVLLALTSKHGRLHSLLTRPVLASWLPTREKPTVMLDLGASFSATADQLLAYAAIGSGLFRTGTIKPSLALLNVGTEFFKGPPELRNANQLLGGWSSIDYHGFVEANHVFDGVLDVIVCDGFTGNSVIKSAEGALGLTLETLQSTLRQNGWWKLLGWLLKNRLGQALSPLDPNKANGALIAGSTLLAVKSHGSASEAAFIAAIERSADLVNRQVVPSIWRELNRLIDDEILD